MPHQGLYIRTCQADECETQEYVRRHRGPVGIPAVEQCQANTEPDPVERYLPGIRIAQKKEKHRRRETSESAPPLVVCNEEIADVVHGDQDDCYGFQPVGVVNGLRCGKSVQFSFVRAARIGQIFFSQDQDRYGGQSMLDRRTQYVRILLRK